MEELKAGWRKVKLGDIIDFNPKETLKKNTISKYVEMAQLQCFARNIIGYSFKEYKGGTKFRNGDTLLARITPCLENGKTAFVDILEEDEVGFGSTEYIVLRKKEGYTDKNYIFYLAISDLFRQIAIKSMTGTSGRQRVQTEVLKNSEIVIPEVNIQKKIASILSLLDEKIELNRKINQNLEEIAQTLFKRWFIDFEFLNEEGNPYKSSEGKMIKSELGEIPEGWRVGSIKEIGNVVTGKTPNTKIKKYYNGIIPFITIPDIHNKIYITKTERTLSELGNNCQKEKILPQNTIVVSCIATVGLVGITTRPSQTNQQINAIILKNEETLFYFFNYLKRIKTKLILIGSSGTATLNINKSIFEKIEIIIPKLEIMINFNKKLKDIYLKIKLLQEETEKLIEVRDYLLPKLMNGEIDVSNLKIFEILNSD